MYIHLCVCLHTHKAGGLKPAHTACVHLFPSSWLVGDLYWFYEISHDVSTYTVEINRNNKSG